MTCLCNDDAFECTKFDWILMNPNFSLFLFSLLVSPIRSPKFEWRKNNNNKTPICIHIRKCIFEAEQKFHAFLLIFFQCHFFTNTRVTESWTFSTPLLLSLFFRFCLSLSLSLTHTHSNTHTPMFSFTLAHIYVILHILFLSKALIH